MKRLLKWIGIGLGVLIAGFGLLLTWAHGKTENDRTTVYQVEISGMDSLVATADVAMGERIVKIRNGCIDCHGEDFGGRVFLEDPAVGTYAGANITPYALKERSNEDLARAIHFGIGKHGQPLRFMPALEFNALSKNDLASVIAYLRQVPEVARENTPITIGPLAKILNATGQLPLLFSTKSIDLNKDFNQKPVEEISVAFGSYLANSSCIGCHNPEFSGGPIPGAPPEWAPAASIRLGANTTWTEEAFVKCLQTGISPTTGDTMKFPMPINIVKNMNEVEMKALFAYLVTLK